MAKNCFILIKNVDYKWNLSDGSHNNEQVVEITL